MAVQNFTKPVGMCKQAGFMPHGQLSARLRPHLLPPAYFSLPPSYAARRFTCFSSQQAKQTLSICLVLSRWPSAVYCRFSLLLSHCAGLYLSLLLSMSVTTASLASAWKLPCLQVSPSLHSSHTPQSLVNLLNPKPAFMPKTLVYYTSYLATAPG